jgi:hypothetical protein
MDRIPAVVTPAQSPGARRGARLLLTLSCLLAFASCQAPPTPITGTLPSTDALAAAVLDAIAARDDARLRALALTEAEFRGRIWPELPASRPERNLPADYVWNDLAQKSEASRRGAIARFGGQRLTLRAVEFTGGTTDYETFSVSRKTELVVADEHGEQQRIRVFGSVLRADGGVKVFSYVVD